MWRRGLGILLALAVFPGGLAARPAALAMFPPDVIATDPNDIYRDWIGPALTRMGERPLWGDGAVAEGEAVYRFTFLGNLCTVTAIRLWQQGEGGRLRMTTLDRCHRGSRPRAQAVRTISATDWAGLAAAMEQAQVWPFRASTWDGDSDEIYLDCTYLAMERALPGDYRVAQNMISCIRPAALMPVVNRVAELAGAEPLALGYRDYRSGEHTE
jgi:hypothetical protein